MRSIVIGTAGHIDHGKTALVKAITGIDPSRLNEEKERGITIDLGFANRMIRVADGSPLQLSLVDVPGHIAFIRNMLAGVGGIDIVLLVISAEEGIKPQTREHLAICNLLGVRRGIAVLSKADAVSAERLLEVREGVRQFLEGSFIDNGPIWPLPVSAHTGAGLPELIDHIAALANQCETRDAHGLLRLPIDRSFSMRGFGTVVTGTLMAGSVAIEQKISIEPGGRGARIRSIQVHGRNHERAEAGSRVALNLAGIDHSSITRGDTVVEAGILTAVREVDAEVTLLPGAVSLKHGAHVTFHAFTSDSPVSVLLYSRTRLDGGSSALARLKLGHSVVLTPGDRFILRLPSPSETIAGGVVLDATPLPRQSRPESRRWLETLQAAKGVAAALVLARVRRRQQDGLDTATAAREMGMTPERIGHIFGELVAGSQVVEITGSRYLERALYDSALTRVVSEVNKYHGGSPAEAGINRAELQKRSGLPAELFVSVLSELTIRKAIRITGDLVSAYTFAVQAAPSDRRSLEALTGVYFDAALETPGLRDLSTPLRMGEREIQRLLALLVKDKILIRIGNDAYVHRDRLAELRSKLSAIRGQSLGVVQFKEITGLSRKHAIPWLEYLDRERITRRVGDSRLVL